MLPTEARDHATAEPAVCFQQKLLTMQQPNHMTKFTPNRTGQACRSLGRGPQSPRGCRAPNCYPRFRACRHRVRIPRSAASDPLVDQPLRGKKSRRGWDRLTGSKTNEVLVSSRKKHDPSTSRSLREEAYESPRGDSDAVAETTFASAAVYLASPWASLVLRLTM